jgi:uncharacterized membrane protein YfcA
MEWALPQLWPLLLVGGFVVGFLVGLTGVGAGSLTTPFLISIIGVNPLTAVGTDLLFACITKASSAFHHHRLGNVDYKILGWLAAGSLPGAGGVFLALSLSGIDSKSLAADVRFILAIILVISAVAIATYPFIARRLALNETVGTTHTEHRPLLTLVLGILIGVTVALTSVGAGAIGVVMLTAIYPALAMRRLVGTDVVHAIPLTLAAGLGHLSLGHVDVALLATLLAGSVPGIALGTRLTGILPDYVLRMALSAILCLAAYTLSVK